VAYSIDHVAAEMMLETEELKEILIAFFEDAPKLIEKGIQAAQTGDRLQLSRSMHSLKGAALNMRMDKLGELANRAETGGGVSLQTLQEIQAEYERMEIVFHEYFSR